MPKNFQWKKARETISLPRGSEDAWCGEVNKTSLELTRKAYLGNVRFVDEEIGRIDTSSEL